MKSRAVQLTMFGVPARLPPPPAPPPKAKARPKAPKPPSKAGLTRTTAEAKEVLERVHGDQITAAREIATELCARNGRTHSREVRAVLASRGLLRDGEKEFWLGTIWDDRFVKTGETFSYSDRARNVHERSIAWWRLK